MESWFIIIIILSLCILPLLKSLFNLSNSNKQQKKLPPGPIKFPFIGNLLWLRNSIMDLEPILRDLTLKYGPLITLTIGSQPAIFVRTHSLAHRALVQNGAVFSDRPKEQLAGKVVNSNQHVISSAAYGPTWRLLRRNLTSEILHPSRIKSYSRARQWVLGILIHRLNSGSRSGVRVVDHFQYAMFCLLALMCFGDKVDEKQIKEIENVLRRLLLSFRRFNVLNFWPTIGKIIFRNRWNELLRLRHDEEEVLIPLIKSRIKAKEEKKGGEEECVVAYVDTLVDLLLPEENQRHLTDGEMVSLCAEFINAGTDTTSTALQWIMANLVKYPHIQEKVYNEICGVVGPPSSPKEEMNESTVKEEDLQRMPYLKAVVLESLRRHPPGHFVLPHTVTEDVELDGYEVPKNVIINFMVADMGWDPKVWEDPMEFKPERFLGLNSEDKEGGGGEAFDITGNREIKMMPFGAGRRICPGSGLALLHLEYFVANLIWFFEWTAEDGDEIDLSEKQEFTVVMKHPLTAHVSPRFK